jgi:predicted DNA-binding transcriptional regulator YafY
VVRKRLSSTFAPTERTQVQRLRERILVGRPASEAVRSTWREPHAGQAQGLQEAFISSRVVQFRYRARDQRLSQRRVEPQYLLLNHPAWYLLGLDRTAAAGRTFRLDGIERLKVLDDGFVQLPHRQLAPDVEDGFRPV